MSYYHFTKGCHLESIVKEGIIRKSNTQLDKGEKPATWLSKSPNWEVACNVGHVLNADDFVSGQLYKIDEIDMVTATNDYMKKEIGMCRILISERIPVITWAKFKHVSGISENTYDALDSQSRSAGSQVDQWLCTFNGIPKKYWEGIEMYVDDQWVRWDEKINIQDFVDLCLSCNGKQEELINGIPENLHNQIAFMIQYKEEIISAWESNKHKKGYIEIFITPDYVPSSFKFIEKKVKKSTFDPLWKSETNTYALVHFLWEADFSQYWVAFPY